MTKASAKHLGASTQLFNAPAALKAKLKDEILNLNPPVVPIDEHSLKRLDQLRKHHVGGVLMVVKHWNESAPSNQCTFEEPRARANWHAPAAALR